MSANVLAVPANQSDEVRERAAFDVAHYIRRHGLSLHDIIDLSDNAEALDAVETLIGEADKGFPEPDILAKALDETLDCLAGLSYEFLDHLSHIVSGPADLLGAVNWHGARVTDLLRRIRPTCSASYYG